MSLFRALFSSRTPRGLDPEVQEMLRRQAEALNAALMRAMAQAAAQQSLREADIGSQDVGRSDIPEVVAGVMSACESLQLPVTTVRLSQMLCEVVVATADRLNEEDASRVVTTLDALLPVLFGQSVKRGFAAEMVVLHGETVAAVLPGGWTRPLVDVPNFRDAGWGLIIGNAVAGVTISDGWTRRRDLAARLADNVVSRLTEARSDAPLQLEKPSFPRRHPLRWTASAVCARAELEAASVQSCVEATEACLPRLLEGAFADRLQDQLLNGEAPVGEEVELPPILGLAVIAMAARVTAHEGVPRPGAEMEAATRWATRVFGLSTPAAQEAATRWAELWRASVAHYEGASDLGLPEGDGCGVLSHAQTLGSEFGVFVTSNVDPGQPGSLVPSGGWARAFARLFRFAELHGSGLPALPKLGTWPAPDPQAAESALMERFSAAQVPAALIAAWKHKLGSFRQRLQALFALLDRLLPLPSYLGAAGLDWLAEHREFDKARALAKASVSAVLEKEPCFVFLSALCLSSFDDLVSSPADCFALLRLAVERVGGPDTNLLTVLPRNDWLAADYVDYAAKEPFARAQAALAGGALPASSRELVDLAQSLAAMVRNPSVPAPTVEQEVQRRLVIRPTTLHRTSTNI